MELLNLDEYAIESFAISSLSAGYTFSNFLQTGDLTLMATIENIFDKKYEVSGYGWNYGTSDGLAISLSGGAEYYVASERSWFGQVKLTLF
jgi:outer membrane receptor protein involved in Fe transport